ncbi:uncharacterized protein [Dermacentor albipictus]|uniref:uncharacterized protein n=1 Tax=Dermacentor albipictus TaxID=60249 RepID=UPI0038FBEE10
MKADIRDILLMVIAITAERCCSTRHSYRLPSCNAIITSPSPTDNCQYLCINGYGKIQYGDHKNGMPCRLNWGNGWGNWGNWGNGWGNWGNGWGSWGNGRCMNGTCQVPEYNRPGRCDNVYRNEGYATTCNFTCSEGYRPRNIAYLDGTPCVTLNQRGKPTGGAGLCRNGICIPGYDLDLGEEKKAHPPHLKRCNDKENYLKVVLHSCYHYCYITGKWYYGYYNSNYSSSCHLLAPRPPNELGWCCKGECIEQAFCGVNSVQ